MKHLTTAFAGIIGLLLSISTVTAQTKLLKPLADYTEAVTKEFDQIPAERKASLTDLGDYIYEKSVAGEPVKLTVICTHNSRRSHIGQLWLLTAAAWYGIENVEVYSGGTEATAFNQRAVDALSRAGFRMRSTILTGSKNAQKASFLKGKDNEVLMFSKKYGNRLNPSEGFAALMVCSDADKSCPDVDGAEARFSQPFDDPRHFDNTASESLKYDETVTLIAREMLFAMHHAKERLILDKEQQK